jgi:hypothetical protein
MKIVIEPPHPKLKQIVGKKIMCGSCLTSLEFEDLDIGASKYSTPGHGVTGYGDDFVDWQCMVCGAITRSSVQEFIPLDTPYQTREPITSL